MSEKLYPHLIEIDRTTQERMDTILSTYYKGDTRIDAVMCNNDAIALGVLALSLIHI
mgnify:CR=1 FL=1